MSERTKSPRRGMCAAILTLEAIAFGLVTPVLITVSHLDKGPALSIGLGLMVACFLLAGMLRKPWAYDAAWVVQFGAVAVGFLEPMMFVVGGLFLILWASADLLGRKIDRERAAAFAAYDADR